MRKFVILLILSVLMGVVPIVADDHITTIAGTVIELSESDEPEFTILLAAVQAADPIILEELADEEENYTVFAPTDAAFAAALEALDVSAEDLLADSELVTEILLYHVVPTTLMAEDVVTLDGSFVGTALNEAALTISVEDDSVFVNDAAVVATDVEVTNGVVHVIDSVLLPPAEEDDMDMMMAERLESSIAEIVVASAEGDEPEFTILLAAVQAADESIFAELNEGGPFTVFAPTDEAFAALLEALETTPEDLLADTGLLNTVLAYHVAPGEFGAPTIISVAEEGIDLATLLPGEIVTVTAGMDGVTVNNSNVIQTDIFGTNGVIHVIDGVLLPPADEE